MIRVMIGQRRMRPSEVGAIVALIVGIGCGVASEAWLHLSELWVLLPWIAGLAAAGTFYGGWLEVTAWQNLSDRR